VTDFRVTRGWIYVHATRNDDGKLVLGTGEEMRLSPAEAVQERLPAGPILKASFQRLAFWRR
jgi:hypothetical protein